MTYKKNNKSRRVSKAVQNYVQRTIAKNIETKQRDLSWDASFIQDAGRTPLSINCNDIAQGDSQSQRQGNQVYITGMYGRVVVTGADSTNIVRVIVYMPHDTDDQLSSVPIDVHTLLDADKYTVLYDRYFTTTSNGPNIVPFTIKKNFHRGKRKGIRTIWTGAGSTDWAKNAIKMYVVSDSGAVSDPTLTGSLRVYYKDA